MSQKYIINIGRQLGSGGREIGQKLADSLNFSFYDKELINLASKESGLSTEIFEKADEKTSFSFFDNFLGMEYTKNYLGNENLFKLQSDIIEDLVEKHSCIFIGRCADYILRDHPNCINIFICADKEDRIKRTAIRKKISEKDADRLNYRTDKKRKEYYNFYTNKPWGRASSYDLCINSSILNIEGTTEFIAKFIKQKFNL